MTELEFNNSLMAQVQLSLATSKIAVDKAANEFVKSFSGFELSETTALASVLKDSGTLIAPMEEETKNLFTEIESTETGTKFDLLYLEAQLKNHQQLRDLTEDYLNDAPANNLDVVEVQGKHIATLVLPAFEEHINMIERLQKEFQ